SSVTITPVKQDAASTITVNNIAVASGTPSGPINLNEGDNIITTVVTEGPIIHTYSTVITRLPLASLISLSVSPQTPLKEVSGVDYKDYTATVNNSVSSVTITPVAPETISVITVNNVQVTSGTASGAINLNEGLNTITTVVTNGAISHTYSIAITRRPPAQLFSLVFNPAITLHAVTGPDYKNYIGTVDNSVSTVTVTPQAADASNTITVNNVTVVSGTTSGAINLNEGDNTITTIVTEGTTSHTYSTVITRLPVAALISLSVSPQTALKEVAGSHFKDYTASVVNSVSSVTITPVASEIASVIRVNNVQVTSGTASGAINLNEGVNTITTVVTNGAISHTYSIRITRQPPAQLFSLVFNPGITVHAITGPDYRTYAGTVDNSLTSVTATPKVQDPAATITVNNIAVASGTASGTINLNEGDNTIAVVITQGSTSNTYSFVITRTPSSLMMAYDPSKETPITGIDIIVHQNVSPNGDGRSDGLVIEGIVAHPDNKLQIMSRSGALVYEAKGYDNVTKVFDGHASNGKLQQAGTYFYSLEYKDGNELKRKTGFIVLKY
ncbi:MAG: cadherin-like beta sandwich domain-containing protein, partial [Mucilaginibacter sp.]